MPDKTNKAQNSDASLNTGNWAALYSDYLYNYACFRVNNKEEARDLVQDTFLSALRAKDSYKGMSSEKTWLVSILKNKIIDYYRKNAGSSIQQSIEGKQVASDYDDYFSAEGKSQGHWLDKAAPGRAYTSAQENMETREFYDILNKCLDLLPVKWAAIFKLKNMEDVETDIICKELNITPSNYWIMMHRAKLQLRRCMEVGWLGAR